MYTIDTVGIKPDWMARWSVALGLMHSVWLGETMGPAEQGDALGARCRAEQSAWWS